MPARTEAASRAAHPHTYADAKAGLDRGATAETSHSPIPSLSAAPIVRLRRRRRVALVARRRRRRCLLDSGKADRRRGRVGRPPGAPAGRSICDGAVTSLLLAGLPQKAWASSSPRPRGVDGPHGSRDPLRVSHEHRRRRADFPAVGGTRDAEPSVALMELRQVLTEAPARGVWAMPGRRSATGSALLRKPEARKNDVRV